MKLHLQLDEVLLLELVVELLQPVAQIFGQCSVSVDSLRYFLALGQGFHLAGQIYPLLEVTLAGLILKFLFKLIPVGTECFFFSGDSLESLEGVGEELGLFLDLAIFLENSGCFTEL